MKKYSIVIILTLLVSSSKSQIEMLTYSLFDRATHINKNKYLLVNQDKFFVLDLDKGWKPKEFKHTKSLVPFSWGYIKENDYKSFLLNGNFEQVFEASFIGVPYKGKLTFKQNNKWGIVDTLGKIKINASSEIPITYNYSHALAAERNKGYFFYDENYNRINSYFYEVAYYNNNIIIGRKNTNSDLFGVENFKGEVVIPFKYDAIHFDSERKVLICANGDNELFFDVNGNKVSSISNTKTIINYKTSSELVDFSKLSKEEFFNYFSYPKNELIVTKQFKNDVGIIKFEYPILSAVNSKFGFNNGFSWKEYNHEFLKMVIVEFPNGSYYIQSPDFFARLRYLINPKGESCLIEQDLKNLVWLNDDIYTAEKYDKKRILFKAKFQKGNPFVDILLNYGKAGSKESNQEWTTKKINDFLIPNNESAIPYREIQKYLNKGIYKSKFNEQDRFWNIAFNNDKKNGYKPIYLNQHVAVNDTVVTIFTEKCVIGKSNREESSFFINHVLVKKELYERVYSKFLKELKTEMIYEGPHKTYDFDNNLVAEANFKSGKLDGEFLTYFSNGKKQDSLIYKMGELLTGVRYFENGKVKEKFQSINAEIDYAIQNVFHGDYIRYFTPEVLLEKGTYNKGKKVGDWVEYYENGNLKSKGTYDSGGNYFGKWVFYYENGNVKVEGNYLRGKKDGHFKWYDESGNVNVERSFKNNRFVGEFTNGIKTGDWEEYYKNGNIAAAGKYNAQGEKIGTWTFYFQNDNKRYKSEGKFIDGKKDGQWLYYHKSGGKIAKKETYVLGELNGVCKWYNEDGRFIKRANFKNGQQKGGFKYKDK